MRTADLPPVNNSRQRTLDEKVKRCVAWGAWFFRWNKRQRGDALIHLYRHIVLEIRFILERSLRILHWCRNPGASERYWLSVTQEQQLGLKLAAFQPGRDLLKASTIRDLHPILPEEDCLLRIQTRLRNFMYHEGIRHPILLPGDRIATELIATGLHQMLLHAGVTTTIEEHRERFWVTKAKQ